MKRSKITKFINEVFETSDALILKNAQLHYITVVDRDLEFEGFRLLAEIESEDGPVEFVCIEWHNENDPMVTHMAASEKGQIWETFEFFVKDGGDEYAAQN